jgi:hypothetical protein
MQKCDDAVVGERVHCHHGAVIFIECPPSDGTEHCSTTRHSRSGLRGKIHCAQFLECRKTQWGTSLITFWYTYVQIGNITLLSPQKLRHPFVLDRLAEGSGPLGPDALRPYIWSGRLCPNNSLTGALPKRQMAPKVIRLMSSGSKKKEPKWACLLEARACTYRECGQRFHPPLHTSCRVLQMYLYLQLHIHTWLSCVYPKFTSLKTLSLSSRDTNSSLQSKCDKFKTSMKGTQWTKTSMKGTQWTLWYQFTTLHHKLCHIQWTLDISFLKGTEKMNEICAKTKNPKNHFF